MKTAQLSTNYPSQWKEKRFKYLSTVQKGRLPPHTPEEIETETSIPYLSMEYLRDNTASPSYVLLEPGLVLADKDDILLLWDGSNAGEFLRARKGAVSSTIARITPQCVDPNFLFWACKGAEPLVRSDTIGMGIPHVDSGILANLKLPLPTIAEQCAIANYLGRETTLLDELVVVKEWLLVLLAEKRRALITHAVTRGLDPDVPLRDSGIPWLTKIPAHWDIQRVASLFQQRDERGEPELPLLEVSINAGVSLRKFSDDRIETTASDFNIYKVAREGDVVFNKMRMWQGAVGITPEDGLVSPDYTVAIPLGTLSSEYAEQLFRTKMFSAECARYSHGIVWDRLRLYWEGFRDIVVPLPPSEEQQAIVAYIATETAKLDTLKLVTERTIALLKERRAALIVAAVTGKIKVV